MFKKGIGIILLVGIMIIGFFLGMGESVQATPVLPDPGTLEEYRGRNQEVFAFRVTGESHDAVWGTDIYTDDSWLATAAVHAGALEPEQEGIVTVMILPGFDRYEGSTRYGVESYSWDEWDGSFQFVGVKDKDDFPREVKEKTALEAVTDVPDQDEEQVPGEIGTSLVTDTQLTLTEQRDLARQLFTQIAEMDMWDLEGMEPVYVQIIIEAPDTVEAEEAVWFLSNMYLRAFEPPRYHEAIALFEHYLARYPESTQLDDKFPLFSDPGLPLVINRLLFLYEETEAWGKAADLFHELIPDPSNPGRDQLEHLAFYGRVMEEAGRPDEAIIAYQTFLREQGDPGSFWEDFASYRLEELGVEVP